MKSAITRFLDGNLFEIYQPHFFLAGGENLGPQAADRVRGGPLLGGGLSSAALLRCFASLTVKLAMLMQTCPV